MFGLSGSCYLSIPNTCKTPCVCGLGWGRSTVSLASVRCRYDPSSVGQRGVFLRNVSANSLFFASAGLCVACLAHAILAYPTHAKRHVYVASAGVEARWAWRRSGAAAMSHRLVSGARFCGMSQLIRYFLL